MKTITDVEGIYASSIHCGIKKRDLDLAYIYVPEATACVAVFTQNKVQAHPVRYSRKVVQKGHVQAVIINSGNANTMVGDQGLKNTQAMARLTARHLGLRSSQVAVASTGIIGVPMPMAKIEAGIPKLLSEPYQSDGELAAKGIMTTDTKPKSCYYEAKIGKKVIQVAGIAKGSGMIAPNMATMLGFLVTNVMASRSQLAEVLNPIIDTTFNAISVDSDTSTNDTVMMFASGKKQLSWADKEQKDAFCQLVHQACQDLALQIILDGEGITKLIEVSVTGAANHTDAKKVAKNIIDSPLVKTAVHGADPNWGRLLMAIGKDPSVKVNQEKIDVQLLGVGLMQSGEGLKYDQAKLRARMKSEDTIKVAVNLNLGNGHFRAWGCDLSKVYIDINTQYN